MVKKKTKTLYRSNKNKILGGVCGGIGEYFDIDPTIIRIIWIIVTIFTAFVPGILVYILALLVMPKK